MKKVISPTENIIESINDRKFFIFMGKESMKLTIIEPHQHFGVLRRWVQVCTRTNWEVHIISSQSNWDKLNECIAEDCSNCSFTDISHIDTFPKTDLLIFTSMQTAWWKWLKYVRQYPSGLIIHNRNMYFQPFQNIAGRRASKLSLLKYTGKLIYEYLFNYPARKSFLKNQDFIIPFSSKQEAFFSNHHEHVSLMPVNFQQHTGQRKEPKVLLYLYNRLPQIDVPYMKQCLENYQSAGYKQILISTHAEFEQLKVYFNKDGDVVHLPYPVSPKKYFNLLQSCQFVCLPFQVERVFNIFKEKIGTTKYSGRIRDAREFGCELHMPDDVPRESGELPSLEEAAERMNVKLKKLYAKAQKGKSE